MRRWLARIALGLLVLAAELTGRSLMHRINVGRHVRVSDGAFGGVIRRAVRAFQELAGIR